jgi:hypothetical protein
MSGAPTTEGGTQVTGGTGGTTFSLLSSIGSDLSVSVSFNIARELLEGANDLQMGEDELIGLVLGFAMVAAALQSRLSKALRDRQSRVVAKARSEAEELIAGLRAKELFAPPVEKMPLWGKQDELYVKEAERAALAKLQDRRSVLDFASLLVSICSRILIAISIQLLAASVRAQQQSRVVRTVSLIGLAVFFVFVESLSNRIVG